VIAHCYDSLVADRLAVDDLRGHDDPMDQANLENEIDACVVEALLAASEAHVELAHRWFRRKAALLGLERLDAVDLQAAAVEERLLPWDEARRLVVDMFGGVTPALGTEAESFFSENRIDAEPRRAKPSGAFCVWPSTRAPGFVCVNWTGQLRDLAFLAHELGHGWASLPHFVHARFSHHAYTFAFLLAAGLVAGSGEPGFAARYERFLTAGGSASPAELMAVVGVDLGDPEIWNDGFSALEGFVERMC
jgi:oligoendopeptidase F